MPPSATALLARDSTRDHARQQATKLREAIERQIEDGQLPAGTRIATERQLAEEFGASRTIVRNALAELERAGKIVRKVGHGTTVLPRPDPGQHHLPVFDASPAELMELRLAFEPSLADAMVLNASARDIQAIWDCIALGDAAAGWVEWEQADRAFHLSLVAATHNRLAIGVFEAIIGVRHAQPWLRLKQGHTDKGNWAVYQEQHRQVATAIARRDARMAGDALRDHLQRVRIKMLAGEG